MFQIKYNLQSHTSTHHTYVAITAILLLWAKLKTCLCLHCPATLVSQKMVWLPQTTKTVLPWTPGNYSKEKYKQKYKVKHVSFNKSSQKYFKRYTSVTRNKSSQYGLWYNCNLVISPAGVSVDSYRGDEYDLYLHYKYFTNLDPFYRDTSWLRLQWGNFTEEYIFFSFS